mmetsp:Transcript_62151/g.192915  ORF Transcript_62151/g.192915 Transcript_62151/m.192915 type:complete len:209 (+) Transcript_62151:301-927(+)
MVDAHHDDIHPGLHVLLLGLAVLLCGPLRPRVEPLFCRFELNLQVVPFHLRDLLPDVLQGLLHAANIDSELLPCLHLPDRQFVLLLKLLSVLQHLLDLGLRQTALFVGDLDVGLVVRLHVLSLHLEDAIGIHGERHLDLGYTAKRLRQAIETEESQVVVVLHLGALALVDLNLDKLLIVLRCGEVLALVCWHRAVALDELLHHAACHL